MHTKEENAAVQTMRAGFTLIEILVAVAIIGILGAVAAINIPKMLEGAKQTAAKEGVDNIKKAVINYNILYKKYPTDINQLVTASGDDEPVLEGGEGALEDPWGETYKYERNGKRIVVISAGPDGEFNTDDDIRSDKVAKSKND